jgi:hypothetical protein
MKQITEDYCSFETAQLLKEKGFDEECQGYFEVPNTSFPFSDKQKTRKVLNVLPKDWNSHLKECVTYEHISIPTHQMALKWLREVHDLHIVVYPWQADNEEKAIHWCCTVYKSFAHLGNDVYTNETPKSYEEAVEAALNYVLKNLI